jgi:tetratricopeptide (TPR) repeat protein
VSGVLPTALAGELEPMRVTAHTLDPGVMRLICPSLTHEVASGDPLAGRLAGNLADAYTLHNIASSLLETEDWELAVIRSSFLEKMLRDFACFASPAAGAPHAQVERYGNVIEGACRLQDLLLGELLRRLRPGARLMLGVHARGVRQSKTDATLAYPLKPAGMGIFVAAGPGIRGGTRLGTLDILDIAPTALRALGLGAHAAILDGRAVGDIFDSNPAPDSIAVPAPVPLPAFLDEVALRGSDWECHSLGLDLLESARPQAALPLLQRAAWLRPECPWRAFWLATCLSRLGLESQAREAAATLVDNDDGTPGDARLLLALIHASLGCTAEVLRLLPASIAKDSRAGGLVSTLAHALMDRERWDEAFDLLRERLCVRESNDIWLALTRCYLHHHLFHDAEEASRHVLAQNPRLAHAHLCLARALDAQGRREEAWQPSWPHCNSLPPGLRCVRPSATSIDRAAAILQPMLQWLQIRRRRCSTAPGTHRVDCRPRDLGAVPLPVFAVGNEAVRNPFACAGWALSTPLPWRASFPACRRCSMRPPPTRAGWRPRVGFCVRPPERFVAVHRGR